MFWSRGKSTPDPPATEMHLSEPKTELQSQDVPQDSTANEKEYPGLRTVIPVVFSVCGVSLLTSLDRTIVGVAVPTISNEFNSFGDISWYESAYLLTFCAFQLPMGKVYTFFPPKWTFIGVVLLFELGSIICAAAPSSDAFIIGRAIAGAGSAGTFTGAIVIFVDLLPLHKRPKYQGALGATFGLASIAGPLLGGVFTTHATWRWCFWINVPIGGLAILGLLLLLPAKDPPRRYTGQLFGQKIKQFDPVGTVLLLPGLVLFVLALQWAGNGYAWGSTRVVVSLVLGLLLLVAFGVSQRWSGEDGTVPPRIIGQRSIAAAAVVSLGFGSALFILTFYLPIWYQAIKGQSAVGSGIRLLPYFLGTTVFVIASGILVSMMGYYTPVLIVGLAVQIIGTGLLTTMHVDTSSAVSYGYQFVTSVGLGLSLSQPTIACQAVLSREDIPTGTTIVAFAQFFGGTIFVPVCQAVLSSTLASQLSTKIPGLDAAKLAGAGATNLASLVPSDELPLLLTAYNLAIRNVFYVALAVSCLAFVASFALEWKSVKKHGETAEG